MIMTIIILAAFFMFIYYTLVDERVVFAEQVFPTFVNPEKRLESITVFVIH